MGTTSSGSSWGTLAAALVGMLGNLVVASGTSAQSASALEADVVAVTIVGNGRAILLAAPGQEAEGRQWRFRSFDTSALPQPLSNPQLSRSGTKLLVEGPCGAAIVLDLTRQSRPNASHQYVDARDPAVNGAPGRHTHRLPSQRFEIARGSSTEVVDDLGAVQDSSSAAAEGCAGPTPRGAGSDRPRVDGRLLSSLRREAATADGLDGTLVTDWALFRVAPDPELYVPVLEFARDETVFPAAFDTLEHLVEEHGLSEAALYDRYLRQDLEARRKQCAIYFRVRSFPGTWSIEYWLYYPFDVGGLRSHLHDPEHVFVEVDKLGGVVYRVIGAGHGFLAANNIFSTKRPLAQPIALPLFAMVEFNKHATAPDIDRDGVFTPGIDENEYRERAKVWGVRDIIGTNNNHLLPYDRGMTLPRREEDFLASRNVATRFPSAQGLAAHACCELIPLPADAPLPSICDDATTTCAISSVVRHPDFAQPTTILKDWVFPKSFLRATFGIGPGLWLNTVGVGYSADLDRTPGLSRILPLPGRVGVDVFAWKQDMKFGASHPEMTAGLKDTGLGVGVRYEQFVSNLFGVYTGVRTYSPPVDDIWITVGSMVEVPVRNSGNVNLMVGLAYGPAGSTRFEINVSFGLFKPHVGSMGIHAAHRNSTRFRVPVHGAVHGSTFGVREP